MNHFNLEHEYYELNGDQLEYMLPHIKGELRQQLFHNAYKAIEFARLRVHQANPGANQNEQLIYLDTVAVQNMIHANYDFILYPPNQNNLVRTLRFNEPHSNGTLEIWEDEHTNGGSIQNQFNHLIALYPNGTLDLFYYIRCQNRNNIERFEYSERHRIMRESLILTFIQQVTHRAVDGTIISINQFRPQYYKINF
uniref:Uncharacterized protein n=1 Tax=Meloidogyne floridensis TaxID=298350 RepID=A0A915NT94_9BILA